DSSISRVQGSEPKTNRSSTMSFRTWYTNGSRHSESKSSKARMVWAGYLNFLASLGGQARWPRPTARLLRSARLLDSRQLSPTEVLMRRIGLAVVLANRLPPRAARRRSTRGEDCAHRVAVGWSISEPHVPDGARQSSAA